MHYGSFWPETYDLLTNHLMYIIRYESSLSKRRAVCNTGIKTLWSVVKSVTLKCFHVVLAWGILLQCLTYGEIPMMVNHHPIPVLLFSPQSSCAVIELQNSSGLLFIFPRAFPQINFLCRFDCRDVQGTVWTCRVAVGLSARCSTCNINPKGSGKSLDLSEASSLSSPSSSCIQARLSNSVFLICEVLFKNCSKILVSCSCGCWCVVVM